MRTFSCKVRIEYEPIPPSGDEGGQYWREGTTVRCRSKSETQSGDVLLKDSKLVSLNKYPFGSGKTETSATILPNEIPIACDAYSLGLLTFYGQTKHRITFDELLDQPHQLHFVRRDLDDGRDVIRVDISHSRARCELLFDPSVNYLVRRMHLYPAAPAGDHGDHRVVSFAEVAPSFYFPTAVESRVYSKGGRLRVTMRVTFTDIQVNKPIAPAVFQIHLPPGILVTDAVRGAMFKTDLSGNPSLPATDGKGRALKFDPTPLGGDTTGANTVTQEEPRSPLRFVLPSSLAVLCVAAVAWVVRRRSAQAA